MRCLEETLREMLNAPLIRKVHVGEVISGEKMTDEQRAAMDAYIKRYHKAVQKAKGNQR